jgi:molybdenum cofactor cytidylyltransferase
MHSVARVGGRAGGRDEDGRVSVSVLVLAAGSSTRLGQRKQLLAYGEATLLDHVLETARGCEPQQLLCVIPADAPEIRERVSFAGVEVVENPHAGEGCSSSIAVALPRVSRSCDPLVLLLADQPGVTAGTVHTLLGGRGQAPLAACIYENGRGHPLAFARSAFAELAALHGDKGVWKLLDRRADLLREVPVSGLIPPDIDTWDDYRSVNDSAARRPAIGER